ncbi:3-methylcrotonyl-CoA carboxylase subunit alpha [Aspergillus luchuensis]|uniref:3-methylcrotonyl-CoA carboxylase subunit alpha n=1 Tax=Aspergillus kawachii TaxID=1069201 RepID=A0A146F1H8_ASPKA|nr:3-methylcrotonyl-CoA carboxylase subunit alpha [Aspergillus luchuensis]
MTGSRCVRSSIYHKCYTYTIIKDLNRIVAFGRSRLLRLAKRPIGEEGGKKLRTLGKASGFLDMRNSWLSWKTQLALVLPTDGDNLIDPSADFSLAASM